MKLYIYKRPTRKIMVFLLSLLCVGLFVRFLLPVADAFIDFVQYIIITILFCLIVSVYSFFSRARDYAVVNEIGIRQMKKEVETKIFEWGEVQAVGTFVLETKVYTRIPQGDVIRHYIYCSKDGERQINKDEELYQIMEDPNIIVFLFTEIYYEEFAKYYKAYLYRTRKIHNNL